MLFLFVKTPEYIHGYPWLISGKPKVGSKVILYNRYNGHWEHQITSEDIIVEADSWDNLDWSKILLNDTSKYGYIDPKGNWYGCNFGDHWDLCKYVLKEDTPEEYGWIKVYKSNYETKIYSRRKIFTEEQNKTLIDRGLICMNY